MKLYFADANFYLRFLLQDNQVQARKTEEILRKASRGEIKITFTPEVILEMEFVLRKVYRIPKPELVEKLASLVKTNYVYIEERAEWMDSFQLYQKMDLSLLDIFLFFQAQSKGAEVLSYDQDFEKLKKLSTK